MNYLIVTVVILVVAREGWSISCKVCDEGRKKAGGSDTYIEISDQKFKDFLMEDMCKDDTPQTTCDDDNELCITYKMEFGYKNFNDYKDYDVTMNLYRCGKVTDVKENTQCDEFEEWQLKWYYGGKYSYGVPKFKKCEVEISKTGKFA